ncbi:DUF1697 domain-containing protein [Ostreiculturibacter nitratireducens]|uniref:DUF1697 domain-containing protein n=1 Tax=Ostreiculturibacter nitratireducens TaxID=3075226 RepID=UPI0031B6394E
MTAWVALLRGVNIGGHHKLPMAKLRRVLAELGFEDVATYIQSGNAVFRSGGAAEAIGDAIGEAIAARFGFRPHVFVLRADALHSALARNPFMAEAEADGRKVHFLFLADALPPGTVEALNAVAGQGESARLEGNVLYLHTPEGFGRSALARAATRLKLPMTGRNARSVAEISAIARGL